MEIIGVIWKYWGNRGVLGDEKYWGYGEYQVMGDVGVLRG